jgi:hypothetical protein
VDEEAQKFEPPFCSSNKPFARMHLQAQVVQDGVHSCDRFAQQVSGARQDCDVIGIPDVVDAPTRTQLVHCLIQRT